MRTLLIPILLALAGCQTEHYEALTDRKFPPKAPGERIPILYDQPKGTPYVVIGSYSTEETSKPDSELLNCAHRKGADAIFVWASGGQFVTEKVCDPIPPREPPAPPEKGATKTEIEAQRWQD